MNSLDALIRKQLGKTNVLFTVCTHRQLNIDAMTNVMGLFGQRKHEITFLPCKGDALIDRARSRIASYFMLETDNDILFMVDDDESFKTEDVLKTIENVRDGMDICGGLVMLKKPQTIKQGHIDKNVLFFKDQDVYFHKDAKPVEIHMLGSGFIAIHRRVFQKMIDENIVPFCHPTDLKFWPFFQPYPKELESGKWIYMSEDWSFCDRARNLGFKVWLDPSIFISHVGDYSWDISDCLRPSKVAMDDNFKLTLR